jgi:hypothetical protein
VSVRVVEGRVVGLVTLEGVPAEVSPAFVVFTKSHILDVMVYRVSSSTTSSHLDSVALQADWTF